MPEVLKQHVEPPSFYLNSLYDPWFRMHALSIRCDAYKCPHQNEDEVSFVSKWVYVYAIFK